MELPVIGHCLVVLVLLRNPNRNQERHVLKASAVEGGLAPQKYHLKNLNKTADL